MPARLDEETHERARRAVTYFRGLLPTLNGYVQALTGRSDVYIKVGATPSATDGKIIYYCPPIEMGDEYDHDRMLCDKRDRETLLQLCPECQRREGAHIALYHEVSHIVYGTTNKANEAEKKRFLERAVKAGSPEAITRRVESLSAFERNWMALSRAVSGHFQQLVNGMEDVRVNQRMFLARPGTRVMMTAFMRKIMTEGFEDRRPDGTIKRTLWRDMPLDAQIVVAISVQGMGMLDDGWFHERVMSALKDATLARLLDDIKNIRSVEGNVSHAFQVLLRLRELGFLLEPEERTSPPVPEPESSDDKSDDPDESKDDDADKAEKSGDDNEADGDTEGEAEEDAGAGLPDERVSPEADRNAEAPTPDEQGGSECSTDDTPPDEGDDGGDSSDSPDGAGSDADDAGSGERSDEGNGDQGNNSSPGTGTGSAGGSGGGNGGDPDGGDAPVENNEREDSSDGTDVSSDGVGDDAGGGTESPDTIDSSDEEELTDDESRGSDGRDGDDGDSLEDDTPHGESGGDRSLPSRESFGEGPDRDEAVDGEGGEESGEGDDPGTRKSAGDSTYDEPDYGTPEEAAEALEQLFGHVRPSEDARKKVSKAMEEAIQSAIETAIHQAEWFDAPAKGLQKVVLAQHKADKWRDPGDPSHVLPSYGGQRGVDAYTVPESTLGPALLKMRRAFADNARGGRTTDQKSGRINTCALAKRAPIGDDRLFYQPIQVTKKQYMVIIGVDVSGSTFGHRLDLAKTAAMAQAELLHRLKIPFAIYAHSGTDSGDMYGMLDLVIFPVKNFEQAWDTHAQQRLAGLQAYEANLDGHSLEFYRKTMDAHLKKGFDGVIMYYSDGAMPAENYAEELDVLRREIDTCRKRRYTLMGVGICTSDPTKHGLDTCRVDGPGDISKVVAHLEKRLMQV